MHLCAYARIGVGTLVIGLLGACSTLTPTTQSGAVQGDIPVLVWLTTGNQSHLLAEQAAAPLGAGRPLPLNIEVDATKRYQSMVGFGASLTDSSAWLLQQMKSEAREALMKELFTREGGGVGFDLTRLTIGASDFSRHHYTLNDRPEGETDLPLAHFSIDANRADVLPTIKRALAMNPQLQVMASPWSAPAWMKTNAHLYQGELRSDRYDVFSRYLIRYVDAYAAEGVPIFALTLQNEPHFEPKDYPGMRIRSRARAEIVGEHLGPMLAARGMKTQIIEWDHNWDEPHAPLEVLANPLARKYVSGIGWHCYAGYVQIQTGVRDMHPDKDTWFTECSGGEWKTHWPETLPWMVRNIVIGTTRGWARGVLMWNLVLDEKFGPHLGGCKDCRGVVTVNSVTGEVTRNLEYYALGHASKFVRPGARRIESTAAIDGLETVAFRNVDGAIALIVCNSASEPRSFSVQQGGRTMRHTLPRESIATFVWMDQMP
ncbi:MAG: glycosyl hydrolase [Burkholderiales bacterium]|nr:glycosyl hydrolase [Burkholderiales bacterium]